MNYGAARFLLCGLSDFAVQHPLAPHTTDAGQGAPALIAPSSEKAAQVFREPAPPLGQAFDVDVRSGMDATLMDATLNEQIRDALNESRVLVLGVQVLLSFHYTCSMEPSFRQLPASSQKLQLMALVLLLLVFAVFVSPVPFHLLAYNGNNSQHLLKYVKKSLAVGLMPFAASLAMDVFISVDWATGPGFAAILAIALFGMALFFWYGLEIARVQRKETLEMSNYDQQPANQRLKSDLEHKIEHVLTEARIVLPGARALLGFQFVAVLLGGFEELPKSSQYVYVISLTLVVVSIILLMMPAVYHRIVESGRPTERFYRVASNAIVSSMVFLAIGTCGDFLIVARRVTSSFTWSCIATAVLILCFYGLWFGVSLYAKNEE
jgi:Family of unknown function (DUF6328)